MKRKKTKPAREALVIVDVQKAFEVPPKLVAAIKRYARRFEQRIFTRFVNPPGSLFRTRLNLHVCTLGTPDVELWIPPRKSDVVLTKQGYGLSAAAIRKLKKLGVQRATICGIDTDACVLGVMFSLFDAGIECRVHRDLCWSSSGLHQEAMKIIEAQFPKPKKAQRK
jgi:nicotinamidase-related amidase